MDTDFVDIHHARYAQYRLKSLWFTKTAFKYFPLISLEPGSQTAASGLLVLTATLGRGRRIYIFYFSALTMSMHFVLSRRYHDWNC